MKFKAFAQQKCHPHSEETDTEEEKALTTIHLRKDCYIDINRTKNPNTRKTNHPINKLSMN